MDQFNGVRSPDVASDQNQNLLELLRRLQESDSPPSANDLEALSDLGQAEIKAVQLAWASIQVARRRWLVRRLMELAETNVQLNFDRVFRWSLYDSDSEVRTVAIEGLWEDEDIAIIGPLVRMLHQDPAAKVRAAAATSLGRFLLLGELGEIDVSLGMRVEQALLSVIHSPTEDVEVRRRAVESVACSGEIGVRDIIESAYYDEDDRMRVSALFAMGRSADTRWASIVHAELVNEQPEMRFEAVRACGELEVREAVPDLIELVKDPDAEIRHAAIWALGQIGGKEARRALEALSESADESIRAATEEALEELEFWDETGLYLSNLDELDDENDIHDSSRNGGLDL